MDNQQQTDEIPTNGIIPPPFNPELTEAERDAFRAIAPADKTLIDRHEEGYWRGLVYYYQLEDLKAEVKTEQKVILEINDRTLTVRSTLASTAYIESTMTSMWKIECKASLLPCLGHS